MKSKPVRIFSWILSNALYGWLAYLWLFNNAGWAYRAFIFLFWVNAGVTILGAFSDEIRQKCSARGRSVPAEIDVAYDFILACALASQGHWVLAVFTIVQSSFQALLFLPPEDQTERLL